MAVGRPQQRCAKIKSGKRCNQKFTPRAGTHRKNCYECSPAKELAPVPAAVAEASARWEPGPVEAATRAELESSGRLDTVAGAVAVRLARDLDGSGLTGSQAGSVSAQLMKVMDSAKVGVQPPADEVDEFTERLRAKRASA